MKLGRFRIHIGRYWWIQLDKPARIYRLLWLWIVKEVSPDKVDTDRFTESPEYLPNSTMIKDGRRYRYLKME